MFGMIWALFQACSTKKGFMRLVTLVFKDPHEHFIIYNAYTLAEVEFKEVVRANGSPYIDHLRITAVLVIFVMLLLGTRNVHAVVAALLHDLLEDTLWTFEKLVRRYCFDVASLVLDVTRQEYLDLGSRVRDELYQWQLEQVGFWSGVIKVCDKMHNLATLWAMPMSNQTKTLQSAWDFYLPYARKRRVLPRTFLVVLLYAEMRARLKSC